MDYFISLCTNAARTGRVRTGSVRTGRDLSLQNCVQSSRTKSRQSSCRDRSRPVRTVRTSRRHGQVATCPYNSVINISSFTGCVLFNIIFPFLSKTTFAGKF